MWSARILLFTLYSVEVSCKVSEMLLIGGISNHRTKVIAFFLIVGLIRETHVCCIMSSFQFSLVSEVQYEISWDPTFSFRGDVGPTTCRFNLVNGQMRDPQPKTWDVLIFTSSTSNPPKAAKTAPPKSRKS